MAGYGFLLETEELVAAREVLKEARGAEFEFLLGVTHRAAEAWAAAGGCERCGGRGWVVTWDTMDSLSGCYADYGGCSAVGCTKESREASGLDPGYYSKYDGNRGVAKFKPEDNLSGAEDSELAAILGGIEAAELGLLAAEAGAWCAKGAHVKVVRGRKVPKGTVGEVFWTGKDRYRGEPRVGLKSGPEAETHWTAGKNLELLEAAPSCGLRG